MLTLQNSWYEDGHHFVRWRPTRQIEKVVVSFILKRSKLKKLVAFEDNQQYAITKSNTAK